MLTKRTNILFEKNNWDILTNIARKKNTSVGNLVRKAVIEVYIKKESAQNQARLSALENIKEIKKTSAGKYTSAEIKELINYGRKN